MQVQEVDEVADPAAQRDLVFLKEVHDGTLSPVLPGGPQSRTARPGGLTVLSLHALRPKTTGRDAPSPQADPPRRRWSRRRPASSPARPGWPSATRSEARGVGKGCGSKCR